MAYNPLLYKNAMLYMLVTLLLGLKDLIFDLHILKLLFSFSELLLHREQIILK